MKQPVKRTGETSPTCKPRSSELAEKQEMKPAEFLAKLEKLRKKLFAARAGRIHPQKDDKVLTDWNGLMISAFARSGRALDEKEYVETAGKAADFCLKELGARTVACSRDGATARQACPPIWKTTPFSYKVSSTCKRQLSIQNTSRPPRN